jgi:conjugative relaxase-like TrwC/TraI family protein
MLNIGRLSPDAADYYIGEVATSAEDYYTGRGESEGRWVGSLTETLSLRGSVEPEDFRAVLDGRHPQTGERLARSRTGFERRPGRSPNQPGLFDHDAVDVPRVAARLKVSVGRVWQLLWAGQRAASSPAEAPKRYLVGSKIPRPDGRGEMWEVPRDEVERYEAAHGAKKARPGYDLTLRPPKSVSIVWALGSDEQRRAIRQAHRESVDAVVDYVERHALYARRGTADRGKVETDGLVAAAFDHRTSRAGDPLLHTHVVAANLTRTVDGRWQAIDGRPLFDHAHPGGYVYQAHLRHLLSQRLGVKWESVRNGWAEIEGVPESVIRAFSKRRDEIEEMVAEAGYSSARAHQAATLETRRAKEYGVEAATLEARWRAEAEALGFGAEQVAACFDQTPVVTEPDANEVFGELAGAHGLTRQASTFERKDVVEALAEKMGAAASADRIDELADRFLASPTVVVLAPQGGNVERVHRRGGARERSRDLARYTTPDLLRLERDLLRWASEGFGTPVPHAADAAAERALAARPSLSAEQVGMVRAVCGPFSPAIQVVAGRPGAGKTYATAACVEALLASGVPVLGCALSATAAAELESATNLQVLTGQPARTIARLLLDLDRHGAPRGAVLLVDEASMVGTRDLAALARHIGSAGGAVKLIGDPDQHGPVEAGGLFGALARQQDERVVHLVANNRQLDATERAAIEEFRQGQVPAALRRLESAGRIVKAPTASASYRVMVEDWWRGVMDGSDDPMIAGPNRVRTELNRLARQQFRREGRLGVETLAAGRWEYSVGDWVVARKNDRRLRSPSGDFVKNGSAGVVVAVDPSRRSLTVEFRKEGRVTLPAWYVTEGYLDYGYARTTYGVQGATLDRALYHASDQASFEEGYVALTRGRHEARLYIVDGTAVQDEESVHRGHDASPTGLDTVAEALERRRANRLAHDDDTRAATVAEQFGAWSLRQLGEERRRLHEVFGAAPRDVGDALAAANRRLDALMTRQHLWEHTAATAESPRGLRFGRRSNDASHSRHAERELRALEGAIARTEEHVAALREQWAERRAFFVAHDAEVERLRLVTAAERALELQVRSHAFVEPPDAVVQSIGEQADGYAAGQAWRNAVEEVSVYLERFGWAGPGNGGAAEEVLGARPQDPDAAWGYLRAEDALRSAIAVEMHPAPPVPELDLT